jgi:hypothetical protein
VKHFDRQPFFRVEILVAARILAVDDHGLLRKGIRMLISKESDMQLVAKDSAAREAVQHDANEAWAGNVLNKAASNRNPGGVEP